MEIYLYILGSSLVLNLVMFVPAYIYKTDKLTDISYALTFILLAIFGFVSSSRSLLHGIVASCIVLWGGRLGTFLFIRIHFMKRDRRFDGMREHFFPFLRFWILQAVTVAVVLLSAVTVWSQDMVSLDWFSAVGIAIYLAGLLIEATADYQKFIFNKNPQNRDTWISSGLWSLSRHPNYLGEMLVWIGLYVAVIGQLSGWQLIVGALSPLFIVGMLLFVSGIPLLEKSADKKWGKAKDYQRYKNQTATLIPGIW